MEIYRQGDVILERIERMMDDAHRLDRDWIALGEVTGHAHRIDVGELFENRDGDLFLRVDQLTRITHEEHKTLTLPRGDYRIVIKRQYTPTGWENVRD